MLFRSMVVDPDFPNDVLKVNTDPITGAGGDDWYDKLRYLMMSRPMKPIPVRAAPVGPDHSRFVPKAPPSALGRYTMPTLPSVRNIHHRSIET